MLFSFMFLILFPNFNFCLCSDLITACFNSVHCDSLRCPGELSQVPRNNKHHHIRYRFSQWGCFISARSRATAKFNKQQSCYYVASVWCVNHITVLVIQWVLKTASMSTFYWANDESRQLWNILKCFFLPLVSPCRYMGIGLSAQGVNMNRLPGE